MNKRVITAEFLKDDRSITTIFLESHNGKTNIRFYRGSCHVLTSGHTITKQHTANTVHRELGRLCNIADWSVLANGEITIRFTPKPTGKPVDAKPTEDNYYICPVCQRKNVFSSWVYAHWDINTEHNCFCGSRNIIKQGKLVLTHPVQDEYHILDAKFYPEKDGKQVVAVAVAGQINDWAGYISTVSASAMPSKVVQMVAAEGVKLFQAEAEGMFPGHWAWKRDYRR